MFKYIDAWAQFQNYVVLDSNETILEFNGLHMEFQNYVVLDSNETKSQLADGSLLFQNYVVLDSNETYGRALISADTVLELCCFRQ